MGRHRTPGTPEELQALAFAKRIQAYEHQMNAYADRLEHLQARFEGLAGFDPEREPGAGFVDTRPELLDAMTETWSAAAAEVELMRDDYKAALEVFATDVDTRIVWLRYVEGMKWRDVADEVYMTVSTCFRHEHAGLKKVWQTMPAHYKQRRSS